MKLIKVTKAQDGKILHINADQIGGMVRTKTVDIPDFAADAKEVTEIFMHGINIIVTETPEQIEKQANRKK